MIIKGNPAGSVGFWSKHLLRDDTNEKAEVKEITGLVATDLPGALREMQAVASGSRSRGNFMYQANINPLAHERLTPAQWREAIDTLEKNLGLEGHQRVVVEHIKEGRQHVHVIWNRVDVETMKVADMGGNYRIHMQTSRELEARFDLTPTPTVAPAERTPAPQLWEKRAAERSGIDPKAMRDELTELWKATDCGTAFAAAIAERGYILAKGDRRDFCVIDRAGDAHSLARRLDGVKVADMRARMSDVDREGLPTVEDARATQRSRQPSEPEHQQENRSEAIAVPSVSNAWNGSRAPLGVANAVNGGVEKLAEFVADLLAGGTPRPKRDPAAERIEQLVAQRRALAALESIRDSIERGKSLRPEDLHNLTPAHLQSIRAKGDEYLRELVGRMEDERQHEHDRGRERRMDR